MGIDRFVVTALHTQAHAQQWLTELCEWWAAIASPLVFRGLVTIAAVVTLLWRRREGVWLAVVVWGASAAGWAIRAMVQRERPRFDVPVSPVPPYDSFPSLHATVSMAFWLGLLVLLYPRLSGWRRPAVVGVTVLLVLSTGFTRLWLGVHYPSDVLAGWALASLTVFLTIRMFPPRATSGDNSSSAGRLST